MRWLARLFRWTRRPAPARRSPLCVVLVTVVTVAGLSLTAWGAWIPAKAALGQVLLERAWSDTLADGGSGALHRPWPWADTAPVARLTLPGHHRSWVVLQGVSGEALAWGPGWMPSSALPGRGGDGDRPIVLAGHRDTHFRVLEAVQPGERIELQTTTGRRHFRVTAVQVVDSADPAAVTGVLAGDGSADALVLVTCYPFDSLDPGGPLRWVVTAVEVPQSSG